MMEPYVELVTVPIDPAPLVERVRTDACGAVALFLGVVRIQHDGRKVSGLSYEAYPAMALEQMRAIAREALARFGPCELALVHRTGDLEIGETSVAVAVGAPHRSEAFAACEYAISELKRRVEIWKKEHYVDGDAT
ncbi:MAG: molybdenum cofactor biosynthesis protein MoaE, partial [Candidatus Eremiobacteraeota bacterium]|nr:molybdenum cofactor biosynthesis protein MoaE [Candidatus Eremiobacteraeota bacterium]